MGDFLTFHTAILGAIKPIDPLASVLREQWNDTRLCIASEPDYLDVVTFALESLKNLLPVLAWIDRSKLDQVDFYNSILPSVLEAPRVLVCRAQYFKVSESPRSFGSVKGGSAHEATLRYLLELLGLFLAASNAPSRRFFVYLNTLPSSKPNEAAGKIHTLSGTLLRSFQSQVRIDQIEGLRKLVHSFNELSNNRCHLGQPIEFPALLPKGYEDIVGALEAEFLRVLSSQEFNKPEVNVVAVEPEQTESVAGVLNIPSGAGDVDIEHSDDPHISHASKSSKDVQQTPPTRDPSSDVDKLKESKEPICPVQLQGQGKEVIVLGKKLPALTKVRYQVIESLVKAFPDRLKGKELIAESGVGDAVKNLKVIGQLDPLWAKVIDCPGHQKYGLGYGLVYPNT